jgi:hypothetical protein
VASELPRMGVDNGKESCMALAIAVKDILTRIETLLGFSEKGRIRSWNKPPAYRVFACPPPVRAILRTVLRHDGEGKIIPITAFVAGLEIVPVHIHDPAVGQIAEGAADWVRACVADHDQS